MVPRLPSGKERKEAKNDSLRVLGEITIICSPSAIVSHSRKKKKRKRRRTNRAHT